MKKFLFGLLFAIGISLVPGCYAVIYDEPANAYVVPSDGVLIARGVYYRTVIVNGVPQRFYYSWSRRSGWTYTYRVRVR